MNEFIPKIFTAWSGAKLVKNNGFLFIGPRARSHSFLDRTVEAQRPEKPAESTTGIIPGDRGMAGGSWCRPPLSDTQVKGRQISPAPLAGVVSGQFHESGAERPGAMRNRVQAESGPREVSNRAPDAVTPEGFGCYCADQNAIASSGGPTPPKGLARSHEQGAQGRNGRGE